MPPKRSILEVEGVEETNVESTTRAAPKARQESMSAPMTLKSLKLPPKSQPATLPNFQKPVQLISFSYTPERKQLFDNSAMKFFVGPPRGADLSYGYANWVKRPEEKGRLDGLLQAITQKPCLETMAKAHLVCWRGILCKILVAPYEERDSWTLNVMMRNGVLYLEEHLTNDQLREKESMPERQRQQTYYGYSFESWCTSDQPRRRDGASQWGGDVNTNEQWCSVVKGKLGDFRLVMGGEVDCVRDRYTGQPDTYVELKTSMTIRPGVVSDEKSFEKKLLKFYFQSFLLGVPEIIVGFRNPRGILQTLQTFKTLEIPRMVRGKPDAWDPNLCLAWGNTFLQQLRQWMEDTGNEDDEITRVGRLRFTPSDGVTFRMLDREGVEEVENGEDRIGFLPTWYMKPKPDSNQN
ncbi:RAI1-domain-containing protein [Serendipita vermifera]|nr:RAI1-domain-containing protein [Serendipita vermifera]